MKMVLILLVYQALPQCREELGLEGNPYLEDIRISNRTYLDFRCRYGRPNPYIGMNKMNT